MRHDAQQSATSRRLGMCFAAALAVAAAASSVVPLGYAGAAAVTEGHQTYLPLAHKPPCLSHSAGMSLGASTTGLRVGEALTLTARLQNDGCGLLGLPLYRLWCEPLGTGGLLEPVTPVEMLHYVGLYWGQHDEASFVLRALAPGQAELRASASFEVHLGYPGPAYWSAAATDPLTVTVSP